MMVQRYVENRLVNLRTNLLKGNKSNMEISQNVGQKLGGTFANW